MGKQRFKTIKLFLKLMLLFQIYSHNKFLAEGKYEVGNGAGADLKTKFSEKETEVDLLDRPKRPARLLPLRMIL